MSSSITMLGTSIGLTQVTWHVPAPVELPILLQALVPSVSAATIPCMLVEAGDETARLSMLVVPGTLFPSGTPVQLLGEDLGPVATGVAA